MNIKKLVSIAVFFLFLTSPVAIAQTIWSVEKANNWYKDQPWLIGANYLPQNAVNQLEMWQADTFDPQLINREMKMAKKLGFNSMRVFLHDQLWNQDADGFKARIHQFLKICDKHDIKPMVVFFDSCWDPFPKLGTQRQPIKGLHNSGWVQSPGAVILQDPAKYRALKNYVVDIVSTFRNDRRIIAWDVWNEPDNVNKSSYFKQEPVNKQQLVLNLLPQVFEWVRSASPSQPVTSAVWGGDWSANEKLSSIQKVQIEHSDIISFHNYRPKEDFEKRVNWLLAYKRPLFCTEYMSRGTQSTFNDILPVALKYNVAAYNWGFVAGKSNTIYPWDSWAKAYEQEPPLWFHDIYRPGGQPYRKDEVDFIKSLIKQSKRQARTNHTNVQNGTVAERL
jgi:hypothetical protein